MIILKLEGCLLVDRELYKLPPLDHRTGTVAIVVVSLLLLVISFTAHSSFAIGAELRTQNMSPSSTNVYVDLSYLASHLAEFENQSVRTNGTVRTDFGSIYMFEDFWLQAPNVAKIPVVTRLAGLPVPQNGSWIEVSGEIEHSNLEGGFYFLNASSWTTATIPEIPSTTILAVSFMIFSLTALLAAYAKRNQGLRYQRGSTATSGFLDA